LSTEGRFDTEFLAISDKSKKRTMAEILEYTALASTSSRHSEPLSTLAEYLAMPEGAPYYEFINGIAHCMASPSIPHQECLGELYREMKAFVKKYKLGKVFILPLDVYLSDEKYYQPDMLLVSNDRKGIIQERIHSPPDLVVEVLSPSNAYKDLTHKKRMYEEFGVREYWILDPLEKSVEALSNAENGIPIVSRSYGKGVVESQVLSGFVVNIEQIFAEEAF
jgi:Uma2 family endonuclease